MNISYGQGGWARCADESLPGPLYVRVTPQPDGRLVITELYLDGRGTPIRADQLRALRLADLEALLNGSDVLKTWAQNPGPDLSRLASHFHTSWVRRPGHWVGDSFFAQHAGSGVDQAPMGRTPKQAEVPRPPVPLQSPAGTYTDDFLTRVAEAYYRALEVGRRPAPTLAAEAGVSPRTIHRWVYTARKRGFLPAGRQGRAS